MIENGQHIVGQGRDRFLLALSPSHAVVEGRQVDVFGVGQGPGHDATERMAHQPHLLAVLLGRLEERAGMRGEQLRQLAIGAHEAARAQAAARQQHPRSAAAIRRDEKQLAALPGKERRGARGDALQRQAEELQVRFEEAFWCEEIGTYALALDGAKRPCKVRTSNAEWGPAGDRNLLGRFVTQTFTVTRLTRLVTYYLRQYDASSPPKYSRYSTALHVDYPA